MQTGLSTLTGEPLFAGLSSDPAFIRDAAGNVTYAGTPSSGAVPVAPGTAIERGLPGSVLPGQAAGQSVGTQAVGRAAGERE